MAIRSSILTTLRMRALRLAALMLVALPTAAAAACPDRAVDFPALSLTLENDMFVNTDSNYTSGWKVSAASGEVGPDTQPECLPAFFRVQQEIGHRAFDLLGTDPTQDATRQVQGRNFLAKFGQAMYTPRDFTQSALIANDRPYAGWLYLGLGYHVRSVPNPGPDGSRAEEQRLDSLEVNLGVIGPLALARQAQDLIHDVRGFARFQGWSNQLKNELGVQLVYERKHKTRNALPIYEDRWPACRPGGGGPAYCSPGAAVELIRYSGVSLGNISTRAYVGGELRAGWNIPNDFGTFSIRPGGDNPAPVSAQEGFADSLRRPFGAHFFLGMQGAVTAREFSLDGNLFADSHKVTRTPLVGEMHAGLAFQWGPVQLAVSRVARSREFSEQGRRHAFGQVFIGIPALRW